MKEAHSQNFQFKHFGMLTNPFVKILFNKNHRRQSFANFQSKCLGMLTYPFLEVNANAPLFFPFFEMQIQKIW